MGKKPTKGKKKQDIPAPAVLTAEELEALALAREHEHRSNLVGENEVHECIWSARRVPASALCV